jgi:predicted transcriptional regulator
MIKLEQLHEGGDYVIFDPQDYVDNPIALARIKAHVTQEEVAKRLNVSQAYISKVENQQRVSAKLLEKVRGVLGGINKVSVKN